LGELNISNNKLFWYCSDNGGHAGPKSTGDLRGEKGTLWEGGLRVPGLVEWPARIPKSFASDMPCSTLDIYPTILAATGAIAQNQIEPLDGINLLPLFDGKMDSREKAIPLWAHGNNLAGHAALIEWPYKLHLHPSKRRGKKKGNSAESEALDKPLLYDVSNDSQETIDLSDQQPEHLAKMTAALQTWQAYIDNSLAGNDYPPGTFDSAGLGGRDAKKAAKKSQAANGLVS
jgi:arylsulfatase A-like enzyme